MGKKYFHNGGLSFREFLNTSKNVCASAERDLSELQRVGVKAEMLAGLKTMLTELEIETTYALDSAAGKVLTAKRNEMKLILLDEIYLLKMQLHDVFAKGTDNYDAIFGKSLSSSTLSIFANAIQNMVVALERNVALTTEYGVDEERIKDFASMVLDYLSLYENKLLYKHNFNLSASERSDKREEAYKLLAFITRIGKAYWKRKDAAKAAQYRINF
jgi:hypothetical protein